MIYLEQVFKSHCVLIDHCILYVLQYYIILDGKTASYFQKHDVRF